ncbi:MAG: hypothetical protein ACON34_08065, partial [Flavobacteriales bacterium]
QVEHVEQSYDTKGRQDVNEIFHVYIGWLTWFGSRSLGSNFSGRKNRYSREKAPPPVWACGAIGVLSRKFYT